MSRVPTLPITQLHCFMFIFWNFSVRTVHVLAKIRTKYLPNKVRYITILLGKYILKFVSKEQFHYKMVNHFHILLLFYITIYTIFISIHFNLLGGPRNQIPLPDSPELGPCTYLTQLCYCLRSTGIIKYMPYDRNKFSTRHGLGTFISSSLSHKQRILSGRSFQFSQWSCTVCCLSK